MSKAEILANNLIGVYSTVICINTSHSHTTGLPETGPIVVTEEAVRRMFTGLKPGKSPGPDKPHPRLLLSLVDIHSVVQTIVTSIQPPGD